MPRAQRSRASAATVSERICPLSGPPSVTRYHGGLLWTSVGAPQPVVAGATGQTLRIPLDSESQSIGDADPATNTGPIMQQLAYATCPYLLNYPDAAGAAGRELRPEVAAAQPDVTPDGRTYTFRIRPGFRFSPPSGQAVTAETFKATIERTLSPEFAHGRAAESPRAADLRRRRRNGLRSRPCAAHRRHHRRGRHAHDPADARERRPPSPPAHLVLLPRPGGDAGRLGRRQADADPHGGPLPRRLGRPGAGRAGAEPELHGRPASPDRAHRLHGRLQGSRRDLARRARDCRLRHRMDGGLRPRRAARARRSARQGIRPGEPGRSGGLGTLSAESGPRVRRDRVQHAAAALPLRPDASRSRLRTRSPGACSRLSRSSHPTT